MCLVQAVFFIKKQLNFLIILIKPILGFARKTTSSPKGNDGSTDSQQVIKIFLNSSQVSKQPKKTVDTIFWILTGSLLCYLLSNLAKIGIHPRNKKDQISNKLTLQLVVESGRNSKTSKLLWLSLLPARMKKIHSLWSQQFSHC